MTILKSLLTLGLTQVLACCCLIPARKASLADFAQLPSMKINRPYEVCITFSNLNKISGLWPYVSTVRKGDELFFIAKLSFCEQQAIQKVILKETDRRFYWRDQFEDRLLFEEGNFLKFKSTM